MLTQHVVSLEEALQMIDRAQGRARELGLSVAVAVVDGSGLQVAAQRMDSAQGAGPEVALAKARAAALFRRPTQSFEDKAKELDHPSILLLATAIPDALPVAGGLPIPAPTHQQVAGAVGVSGGTGDQDTDIAWSALGTS